MKSAALAAVIGLGMLTAVVPTRAGDETEAQAKQAFDEGVTLYNAGRFSEAAERFREANRLKPTWKLLYNIGQSEAAVKRYAPALDAFEAYLIQGGDEIDEARQGEVQREIQRLKGLVGYLAVKAPEGAVLLVDGEKRGIAPLPGRVRVSASIVHRVEVLRDDVVLLERDVRLGSGESVEVDATGAIFSLQGEPAEPDRVPDGDAEPGELLPDATPTKGGAPLRPVGFGLLGAGAATLIAGTITGAITLSKVGELDTACPGNVCTDDDNDVRDTYDTAERLATSTNVLIPVGGVLAVGGVVLIVLGSRRKTSESPVAVLPGPAGVTLRGRF